MTKACKNDQAVIDYMWLFGLLGLFGLLYLFNIKGTRYDFR